MLSEQSVLDTHEMGAITCDIAIHLGLHLLVQGKNASIHEHLICDITDVVMVKEVARGDYATERLKKVFPWQLPCSSPAAPLQLNRFHHDTYVNRLWEDSIQHTQKRTSNLDIRIFEGAADLCCDGLA